MIFFKKIIAILMIGLLVFPYGFNHAEAVTYAKTVEFFIGQDSAIETDTQVSFPFFVDIPESSVAIKSAAIEINGISFNDSGVQNINIDLKKDPDPQGLGIDYILGGNSKARSFSLKYDASPVILPVDFPGVENYTFFLKGTSETASGTFSIFSAKLILTYDHFSSGANFLKTTEFFIGQEQGNTSSGTEVRKDFTVTISEQDPVIQSVFVEASGIAKGSGLGAINISVVDFDQPAAYGAPYGLDFSPISSNVRFLARHNALANISSGFPGSKKYTLYLKGDGFSANLWNAKLIITYKYSVNTGNLPARGELISSTFDTGVAKGAAYNSLMWKGDLNGGQAGQVGLQIAASSLSAGPWSFEGPDCTSGSSYNIADSAVPMSIEIACAASHNNKRYFRYKVIICSNVNCATKGSITPQVDEVVVNWGP